MVGEEPALTFPVSAKQSVGDSTSSLALAGQWEGESLLSSRLSGESQPSRSSAEDLVVLGGAEWETRGSEVSLPT